MLIALLADSGLGLPARNFGCRLALSVASGSYLSVTLCQLLSDSYSFRIYDSGLPDALAAKCPNANSQLAWPLDSSARKGKSGHPLIAASMPTDCTSVVNSVR